MDRRPEPSSRVSSRLLRVAQQEPCSVNVVGTGTGCSWRHPWRRTDSWGKRWSDAGVRHQRGSWSYASGRQWPVCHSVLAVVPRLLARQVPASEAESQGTYESDDGWNSGSASASSTPLSGSTPLSDSMSTPSHATPLSDYTPGYGAQGNAWAQNGVLAMDSNTGAEGRIISVRTMRAQLHPRWRGKRLSSAGVFQPQVDGEMVTLAFDDGTTEDILVSSSFASFARQQTFP
eukprot:scaffold7060_cov280-Pinguiococcus_pyrenoidosus.AAC.7